MFVWLPKRKIPPRHTMTLSEKMGVAPENRDKVFTALGELLIETPELPPYARHYIFQMMVILNRGDHVQK